MTLPTKYMRADTRRESRFSARGAKFSGPRLGQQILAFMLAIGLLFVTMPQNLAAQDAQAPAQDAQPAAPTYTTQTPDQLDQLVGPSRSIRTLSWRRFWRLPLFPRRWSKPTAGGRRIPT